MPHQRNLAITTTGMAALVVAASMLLSACGSSTDTAAGRPGTAVGSTTAGGASKPSFTGPAGDTGVTDPGGDHSADPCALLSQLEVDAAAGQPLGHGNRIGALQDCQWSTRDFAGSVEIDVADWTTIKLKSTQLGMPLTSITGVGDEALSFNQAGNAAQLYVRKGKTGFLLLLGGGQYIGALPDLGLGHEKVLAAAALKRL